MYISKFYGMDGKEYVVSDSINTEQIAEIKEAYSHIYQFLNETDHYITVFQNAQEFIGILNNRNYEEETKFIQINRCFTNYLNAFYTWGCFHNHKDNWYLSEQFSTLKICYRENNLVYRLANSLRHYTTHNGFVITKITYDVLQEKTYYWISSQFYEHKNTKRNLKKTYLDEVKACGIDAYSFTLDFVNMFNEMQMEYWKMIKDEICKELEILLKFAATTTPDCYNTYIINSCDDEFHLNIGRILELYSKRMIFLQLK